MAFYDVIFDPLLNIDPFIAILIVSFLLSLAITIIYKLMTDQELMKTLKQDLKDSQKKMKELKDNPEKMLKVQKNAMEKNMKYMMHSMKPTLVTFIPIILIFGWLNANMAYEPIMPGDEFDVTLFLKSNTYGDVEVIPPMVNESIELLENSKVKEISSKEMSFKFKAVSSGTWDLNFKLNNETTYPISIKIDPKEYSIPDYKNLKGGVKRILVGNEKKVVLNLFGWEMGWLMAYIILSIVFSMSLRKLLRIH